MRGILALAICAAAALAANPPNFADDIRPILQAKCAACHSGEKAQAKLDMRTAESLLRGGNSGPAIIPGAASKSFLFDKINSGAMPPGPTKLAAAEVEKLRQWIEAGAPPDAAAVGKQLALNEQVTEDDVLPIFQTRCVNCHGKRQQLGGLDLRTRESRLKGGKSGPGFIPHKPEESLIVQKIASAAMPPMQMLREYAIRPPTEAEFIKIKQWIEAGAPPSNLAQRPQAAPEPAITAKDLEHWAFQPPKRPQPPATAGISRVRNPIDRFVLASLESKQLSYAPEAGKLKLMRRAHIDLTGMPPTPKEVEAYAADTRPDAYERLVDKLLESPHYGERWARYWLDLAGYSDSEGFGQDDGVRPFAWRYRDYVIRAFNSDKPYDQFLTEQIAGDELGDYKQVKPVTLQLMDRLAATGFLRTTPDPTNATERAFIAERMNILADEVEVLSSSVMGLTIGCARCHNHKYDPISQRDYYRFSAILQTSYDPFDWRPPKERELAVAPEDEMKAYSEHNAPIDASIKRLEEKLDEIAKPFRAKTADPDAKYEALLRKFPEFKAKAGPMTEEVADLKRQLKPKPHVRVLMDTGGRPSTAYLLRRGDPTSLADPVEAGTPRLFDATLKPYQPQAPWEGSESSGRRLALARWLTQPNHPLTTRVFVNQMWMRHFGRGIVASPSNFGRSGMKPSHPELLDWLATEFVARGWSVKSMHKLMMTSAAYRQSSQPSSAALEKDPENALVSRMPMRRLDAESLYDSVLRATGRLDAKPFGPPEQIETRPDKEVVPKGGVNGFRRSIYVLHKRQTPVTMLDVFDQPPMTPNCIERRQSTVSTQALQMMNGSVVWEHARYMAGRIIDDVGEDQNRQMEQVYLRALGRRPTPAERDAILSSLADMSRLWPERIEKDNPALPRAYMAKWMALTTLCHTVLNSAEFAFVD